MFSIVGCGIDWAGPPDMMRVFFWLHTRHKNSFFLFLNARRNNSETKTTAIVSNLGPGRVDLISLATTPDNYDLHNKRPKIFNQKPKRRTLKIFFRGKQVLKRIYL